MKIKIKPCPFCGFTAELHKDCYRYVVQCTNCHIMTIHMKDEQTAIAIWNRRTKETDN